MAGTESGWFRFGAPSLRYGLPLLIILFTALLAAYTVHRDRLSAEAIVRGQAVSRMIQRMDDLQILFEQALRHGANPDLSERLSLETGESYAVLGDDAGVVLAATRNEWMTLALSGVSSQRLDHELGESVNAVIERVRAQQNGEVLLSTTGQSVLGVYPVNLSQPEPGAEGKVGVLIVRTDLSSDLRQARATVEQHTRETVVMLTVLAGLMGVLVHLLITRRLNAVIDAARRFTHGELHARSHLSGQDEVARLSKVFNAMASRVEDTQRELEGRVLARTYELARTISDLRREVAGRRRTEYELRDEKEKIQVTLASLSDAVITIDLGGCVEYLNRTAEGLTGWDSGSAIGAHLGEVFRIVDEVSGEPVDNTAEQSIREGTVIASSNPILLIRPDGRAVSIEHSAAPLRDHTGAIIGAVLIFRDVSEVRRVARQLSHQAAHDALTGLVNRREFEQRLLRILSTSVEQGSHCVLYLDLDQFKIVNDTCGHAAGDELLRQIAGVLLPQVRKRDTLARLGGDEFGVLLEDCPQERALRIAQRVRKALLDFRFLWQERSFTIGASVGMVPIDPATDSVPSIFKAADIACYAAKDRGGNRVHVYQHDDGELAARHGEMQWVPRIQQAVAEDRFVLYYQPIVPLGEGGLHHGEILLRLRESSEGDLVMPSAFIPAAERYHQMQTIDRWVIRSVFSALRASEGLSGSTRVAINLSGQSLGDGHFLQFVEEQIDLGGVPLEHVCFEVTETAAISNLSHATRFFSALKPRGCRFALDDFGSGLSSFAYLKNLPVDYLKIDGSFVREMATDPIDYAMVEAIHKIGRVMGIETIAECVESESTIQRLKAIGVNYVQGYALGRPRPFTEAGRTH